MCLILVIDDNEAMRNLLRTILFRYTVLEAANGREGLGSYRAHCPQLVITDMMMPEMDGAETIQALRQEKNPPKIIAISGGGHTPGEDILGLAQRLGADRTLAKPFGARQLLEVVEALIGTASGNEMPASQRAA
jgi:CheY-like chemotaxis protein